MRWVQRDRYRDARSGRYNWPQCSYCGTAAPYDCMIATCELCGSPQCFGNGLRDGTCAICLHGYLPGWSRSRDAKHCSYKGCESPAVARVGRRRVCLEHAKRIKVTGYGGRITLDDYVRRAIEHRDSGAGWQRWTLVEA